VPFVVSTDGLIGRESKNLSKKVALRLTAKQEQPYSVVRGFVNVRINLSILRATNLCRSFRVPASKMSKRVQWLDDGAGLLVVSRTLWYNTVPGTKAALIIIDKMSHDNHG
jgi:hypothetical protein